MLIILFLFGSFSIHHLFGPRLGPPGRLGLLDYRSYDRIAILESAEGDLSFVLC